MPQWCGSLLKLVHVPAAPVADGQQSGVGAEQPTHVPKVVDPGVVSHLKQWPVGQASRQVPKPGVPGVVMQVWHAAHVDMHCPAVGEVGSRSHCRHAGTHATGWQTPAAGLQC
jgi:hypothetical protein